MKIRSVSIVGFGRFGKVLYEMFKDDFQVNLFNRHKNVFRELRLAPNAKILDTIPQIYDSEVVFYAVPIANFEEVIKTQRKYFKKNLLIDTLSVKLYPEKVFRKYLNGTDATAMLTHPMFGPDSIRMKGLPGLPMMLHRCTATQRQYDFWKSYFQNKKRIRIVELSPRDHDRMAANSHGLTHFFGRLLSEFGFRATEIDTVGATKLLEIMDQTCNDTWQLFIDLQNFNPYTKSMRLKIGRAYGKLFNKLLPKRVHPKFLYFGIQGGKASFNEQAILKYIHDKKLKDYRMKYLYTTKKVLKALYEGDIDFGIFAIENAKGGLVDESIEAMADYKFDISEEIKIPIQHFLVKRFDVPLKSIRTIMAHPQVFKQCKNTLSKKYPTFELKSGKGNLIDHAAVAKALSKGKIRKDIAVLGPKTMASTYNLEIIDKNLQDDDENITSFLLVKRK